MEIEENLGERKKDELASFMLLGLQLIEDPHFRIDEGGLTSKLKISSMP